MALNPLSLRAYAAHRKAHGLPGGSLQAVQRAIQAERISCVVVDGAKRIQDPEAADREWADNTDHTRAPGSRGEDLTEEELQAYHDEDPEIPILQFETALEKRAKRKRAELALGKDSGKLVDAEAAEAAAAEDYSLVRDRMLAVPNKVKQRHPEVSFAVLATISEEIEEALEALTPDTERGDDDAAAAATDSREDQS